MGDPQSLEEAWAVLDGEMDRLEDVYKVPADTVYYDLANAARALALAAFDMARAAGSVGSILEQIERQREWRSRIEALGK